MGTENKQLTLAEIFEMDMEEWEAFEESLEESEGKGIEYLLEELKEYVTSFNLEDVYSGKVCVHQATRNMMKCFCLLCHIEAKKWSSTTVQAFSKGVALVAYSQPKGSGFTVIYPTTWKDSKYRLKYL